MTAIQICPIVDENDEVIGYKPRSEITNEDIYRVSGLWIVNSKGDILLTQRSPSKTHDPNRWGPAASGTVEKEETYSTNIMKEAQEELDLQLQESDLKILTKLRVKDSPWNFFVQLFLYKTEKNLSEFKLQQEECSDIKWFNKEDFHMLLNASPQQYVRSLPKLLEIYETSQLL